MLTPTCFPRGQFEKAIRIQTAINELTHRVAHDDKFLREVLSNTIKADEFTANLFKIYEETLKDNRRQVYTFTL